MLNVNGVVVVVIDFAGLLLLSKLVQTEVVIIIGLVNNARCVVGHPRLGGHQHRNHVAVQRVVDEGLVGCFGFARRLHGWKLGGHEAINLITLCDHFRLLLLLLNLGGEDAIVQQLLIDDLQFSQLFLVLLDERRDGDDLLELIPIFVEVDLRGVHEQTRRQLRLSWL